MRRRDAEDPSRPVVRALDEATTDGWTTQADAGDAGDRTAASSRSARTGRPGRAAFVLALVGVLVMLGVGLASSGEDAHDRPGRERPEAVGDVPFPGRLADPQVVLGPHLDEPGWLPPSVEWRGTASAAAPPGVRGYALRTAGPDPRRSTVLLQTATEDQDLPAPVGEPTSVAVSASPATLFRDPAGGRDLRWSDADGSYRLLAAPPPQGPSDAALLQVATGSTDPRSSSTLRRALPVPRELPRLARRLEDVEAQLAGYQPPGSAVRAWRVGDTLLLYRVEPGDARPVSPRFEVVVRDVEVGASTGAVVHTRFHDRRREVRWNADGLGMRLVVDQPEPLGDTPGLSDDELVALARSVG